jgi:hypothetical protein
MAFLCYNAGARKLINVGKKPAPTDFDARVRHPGLAYLKSLGALKPNFKTRNYWTRAANELYVRYQQTCAYSGLWIAPVTGSTSVEHFVPKSVDYEKAYDWDNYRLVCGTLNGRKGNYQDVLDPFLIQDGWFVLTFPSLTVHPGPTLVNPVSGQVAATIKRLKLNDTACTDNREAWLRMYCEAVNNGCAEATAFQVLNRHAPFIAKEIVRQTLRGGPIVAIWNSAGIP